MSRRQSVVWVLAIGVAGLLAGAGVVSERWLRAQEGSHALAREDETSRMLEWQARAREEEDELREKGQPLSPTAFGARHGTNVGHYMGKRYAILPPAPLGAIAVGDADVERSQILVSVDRRQFTGLSDVQHPLWLRAGRFDAAFVLATVLPLFLVAAAAPVLSGDRVGTLPLLVAQGTRLSRVAVTRVLVRGGPVLVAALAATAVVALWGLPSEAAPGAYPLPRLAWLLVIVALYGACWLALALVVDARSRNANTAMLTLAGVWLAFAILIPTVVHVVAVTRYPVASRAEVEEASREAQQRVWSTSSEDRLARFFADHPDIAPERVGSLERFMIGQMLMVLEQDAQDAPLEARYDRDLAAQARFVGLARFTSPVLLAQHAIEETVGSGAGRRARFRDLFEDYVTQWRAFFVPRIYYRIPISDFSTVPVFDYREEPWTQPIRRSLPDAAILALVAAAALWAGLRACRSYRLTE